MAGRGLKLTRVNMMNAGEILELLPRLAPSGALSHKLRTFLQRNCTSRRDGSATIHLWSKDVAKLLVAVREECAAELKGLLPAGVQDSVEGGVLAQLCFCLLLALAPSSPPLPVAQTSLLVRVLWVAVREECAAELKGLLPAGVQDSVEGGVLAQLCFCLLLALAPSLPLPVAQNGLRFHVSWSDDWTWLGSECGEQALEVLCSALMSQHWSTPVRRLRIYRIEAFGTERACQHLAHLLDSTHCKLQSLTMWDTSTTADGTSHIARALLPNTSLTKLTLASCKEVGDRGVEHLAAMLRNNSTIQELTLRNIGMTGEGVGHLRDALLSQSQAASPPMHVGTAGLKTLNIFSNAIGQPGAVHLAAILANNSCSSLRKLNVEWCWLEDDGEGCLAEALRTNSTLEELDISCNKMGQKALEALVRCLATDNSTLKMLDMSRAGEWPAAELIAFMLSSNQSLEKLNLREAPYSATEWATIILPALSGNKTLTSINLWGCEGLGGKQVEAAFFDLLRINNTTIQTVELYDTPLHTAGKAEGIYEEVRRNKDFRNALSTMTQGKPKSCRLILCGNAYAGKTTLFQAMKVIMQSKAQKMAYFSDQPLARLVRGQSSHDRELHMRTRGIEIHSLNGNEDLRISVWDLAGQREFHALHDVMFPTGDSAATLFALSFNPIVSPGDYGAGEMKVETQLEEELLYWLRLIASNYKPGAVAPCVVVVITNRDRLREQLSDTHVDSWFHRAKGSIRKLKEQFDGLVNVGENPFLVNALATQDPELQKLCKHMEQSLMSTLDSLPMEPVICTRVLKVLQSKYQAHPVISISEFAELCSTWSSPEEAKMKVEKKDKDKECKLVAAYLHNCGEVIYHDNLNIIVTQPRWFGHGVLGQLIDIFSCEGQGCRHLLPQSSKPAVRLEKPSNGFVTKTYLNWLLREAVKSVPGMDSKAVTCDQLIHLMLLLNLCYEESHGDPNTGYFLPAIFDDVGNKAAKGKRTRTWRKTTKGSIVFSRRLQCADLRTFLTDGFFPRLQVVLYNHAVREKWVTSGNSDCCTLERNFVSMWVNGMDILIEFSGSPGSFVDIMVKSSQSHQLTMEFVHLNFIGKIRSFCASHEGCQGVTLEERIIRPECFPINGPGPMLCVYRKDQSITIEELRRRMGNTPNYMHSWGEVKDEAGAVLLECSADSGAVLLQSSAQQFSDCYPYSNVADGQKRGIAILISMEKYDSGDRLGGAVDRGRLEALAGSLDLVVFPLVDLSAAELHGKLMKIQEECVLPEDECFVCFVNAHGNTTQDKEHFIKDKEGEVILLDDIVSPFRKCEKLRGKPKMFVVNSCRGTNKVAGAEAPGPSSDHPPPKQSSEAIEYRYVEDLSDCLVAFSTFGGYVSARDPMSGTIFVKALVEAFNSKRSTTDVINIISSVISAVVDEDNYWVDKQGTRRPSRQCPIVVSSLTKRFFLR